jgi:hypothetical protein
MFKYELQKLVDGGMLDKAHIVTVAFQSGCKLEITHANGFS